MPSARLEAEDFTMPPAFFFTGSFSASSLCEPFVERFTYSLTHRASLRWRHTLTNDIGCASNCASGSCSTCGFCRCFSCCFDPFFNFFLFLSGCFYFIFCFLGFIVLLLNLSLGSSVFLPNFLARPRAAAPAARIPAPINGAHDYTILPFVF
jgi:hypothetical protein